MVHRSVRLDPPILCRSAVGIAVIFAKENTPLGQSDYRPSFSIRKNCLVINKSPWSFGRYVLISVPSHLFLLMCLPQKGALMVAMAVSLLWPLHIAPVLVPVFSCTYGMAFCFVYAPIGPLEKDSPSHSSSASSFSPRREARFRPLARLRLA
jgi:hypothetical protein